MSDLVENPQHQFSLNAARMLVHVHCIELMSMYVFLTSLLFHSILSAALNNNNNHSPEISYLPSNLTKYTTSNEVKNVTISKQHFEKHNVQPCTEKPHVSH